MVTKDFWVLLAMVIYFVAMLTIGGRKIVYKPRDLHIHELFAGLVRRCERTKGFLPMRVSDVLTKSGYAYEEFVEHGTCEDARQVERYYTRYGQLLGLVWLLHGDDMHHENIIASGEYPMVVDFETIATNHVTMDMPDGTDATSAYPRYCGIRWPSSCSVAGENGDVGRRYIRRHQRLRNR